MEPQDSQEQPKPEKGYGKRSTKQWVMIYIVAAIVVYGLIYFLFMRGDSGSSLGY